MVYADISSETRRFFKRQKSPTRQFVAEDLGEFAVWVIGNWAASVFRLQFGLFLPFRRITALGLG